MDVVPQIYMDHLGSQTCYASWTGPGSGIEARTPYGEYKYSVPEPPPPTPPAVDENFNPIPPPPPPPPSPPVPVPRYFWQLNDDSATSISSSATKLAYGPNGYWNNLPKDKNVIENAFKEYEGTSTWVLGQGISRIGKNNNHFLRGCDSHPKPYLWQKVGLR